MHLTREIRVVNNKDGEITIEYKVVDSDGVCTGEEITRECDTLCIEGDVRMYFCNGMQTFTTEDEWTPFFELDDTGRTVDVRLPVFTGKGFVDATFSK